jgi:hypothetical protein
MSDQNNQQKGFFGTAASGLGTSSPIFFFYVTTYFLPALLPVLYGILLTSTGNTLGAATNTVGQGVKGVTDATGNVVAAGGKGLGDAVTGITQGAGDTTKGELSASGVAWPEGWRSREAIWRSRDARVFKNGANVQQRRVTLLAILQRRVGRALVWSRRGRIRLVDSRAAVVVEMVRVHLRLAEGQ